MKQGTRTKAPAATTEQTALELKILERQRARANRVLLQRRRRKSGQ